MPIFVDMENDVIAAHSGGDDNDKAVLEVTATATEADYFFLYSHRQ